MLKPAGKAHAEARGITLLQFSVALSRFSEQIKNLSQDLALTRKRVEELEAMIVQDRAEPPAGQDRCGR